MPHEDGQLWRHFLVCDHQHQKGKKNSIDSVQCVYCKAKMRKRANRCREHLKRKCLKVPAEVRSSFRSKPQPRTVSVTSSDSLDENSIPSSPTTSVALDDDQMSVVCETPKTSRPRQMPNNGPWPRPQSTIARMFSSGASKNELFT